MTLFGRRSSKKKPKPLSGSGASFPYNETFGGTLKGAGYYLDASSNRQTGAAGKAISGGKLVLTVTTPGTTYPSQVIPITGFTPGAAVTVSFDYDATGGGKPLAQLSTNASGIGGTLHDTGDLTGSGTYQSPSITASQSTLYLVFFNDSATNGSCSFDNVVVAAASSVFYDETFAGGSIPAGWAGRWLNAAAFYATVNDNTALSIVSGKLRISVTAGAKTYSSAIYTLSGRAGGDVIGFDLPYVVSANGALFVRVTQNADGSSSGLYEGSNLTGSGTLSSQFTVPDGGPALYFVIYNNTETASTVDVDELKLTLVSAGSGGTASAINFLSSKYPVSFASRTGMQIRLSTDVPATFSKVAGGDATEFTIEDRGTAGMWLTHPTGAAGKTCTIRATAISNSSVTVDQLHTLYQKPAIATTTGLFVEPFYAVWTDAFSYTDVDFSKSEFWNIFSVTPDANGALWTTGAGSYWNYGPTKPYNIAQAVLAAGKKPMLSYGGGGLWTDSTKNVSSSIATPAKRAALVTALVAERARIGAVGIHFDIEKGGNFIPADWVLVHDLIKRYREADPGAYIAFPFGGTMFKGTALYDDPSMPEYGPSIAGICDWFAAMDYSMDQKNVHTDSGTGLKVADNMTWYSSPIRGAQSIYHRLDVESLVDWYTRNGMDVKKCLLGSTLMAAYDVGATGPDQWIHPSQTDGSGGSGFWDQHATYDNLTDYYNINMFYDYERKASYGLVPVNMGDGITYISFERAQDWVDRASWAQSKGLLGGILWQTANTHFPSRIYPIFTAFQSFTGATVSADPNYAAGTTVTSQAFSATGGEPVGWFGFSRPAAGVGPWGRDTAALTTSGGKLQIANRSGHTEINGLFALDSLTAPGLYVCFVDIVTDANSNLEIQIWDGNGKNTDITYIGPNSNLTNYMIRCWAFTPYMEIQFYNHTTAFSTVTLDNFTVKGPITHVSAG